MKNPESITAEEFDDAVRTVAQRLGVSYLLAIPGVWELVQEDLNDAAMKLLEEK